MRKPYPRISARILSGRQLEDIAMSNAQEPPVHADPVRERVEAALRQAQHHLDRLPGEVDAAREEE